MGQREPKFDRRLIGGWQSDRRRTFRHFKPKMGCPPQSFRKLKAMFGKLVIRWGRGRCHTELDGYCDSVAYEVIARDTSSVVIHYRDCVTETDTIQHIHFEENYYWIAVSGSLIEWFRRVE